MVESSQASPALEQEARALVDEALARVGVERDEVPPEVIERVSQRGRIPDQRMVVGRYLIVGELGRGGMGVVYEAWDPGIERWVAIKTIEPDLVPEEEREEVVERFRRETKIVGRLHHPSIVTIYDSGNEKAYDEATHRRVPVLYYYVMEYLEGRSLARVLRERELLPEVEAIKIAADIAEALQLSHDAGIIHRDIKPSNIFLRDNMQAVLLDFGIAKTGSVALTRQGQILGTPSYLAPERLREKEVAIDGRADIFSLGVLLFTMLTGEAPFVGEDVYEVIDKIAKESHPRLERATPAGALLSEVIDRMLAKDPEHRYQTAAAAAEALREVLHLLTGERPTSIVPESALPDLSSAEVISLDESGDEENTGPLHQPEERAVSEEDTSPKAPISGPSQVPDVGDPAIREALSRGASVPPARAVPPPLPTATDYRIRPDQMADEEDGANRTAISPRPDRATDGAGRFGPTDIEQTAEELPAQKPTETMRAATDEPQEEEPPVRAAEVLGTRPELALQRDTRELNKFGATIDDDEPPHETTNPSIPPFETAVDVDRYPDHAPETDETTDDETIAEPDPEVVKAFAGDIATEQLEDRKRADSRSRPPIRGSSRPPIRGSSRPPPRSRRSRIEASLVDEDDVVVKPAPLDSLKPDELPTQTGFKLPSQAPDAELVPAATSAPDVVRARGDSRVQDPAETGREERTEAGPIVSDLPPEEDEQKSAAVARKTFGASARRAPSAAAVQNNIQVKVSGRTFGVSDERMKMLRRRGVMLLAGALASVGIGLMLGRMQRAATTSEEEVVEDRGAPAPQVEPRASVRTDPTTGQLDLVRPRPPSELIADAEAAQTSGQLEDAARLFRKALESTKEGSPLRSKALLGLADVLRAQGDEGEAIKQYRTLVLRHPGSDEARQARVVLTELKVPAAPPRPRSRSPEPHRPKPAPPPKNKEKEAVLFKANEDMTGPEMCSVLKRKHLRSDPARAVRAFEDMRSSHGSEPCVYWNLGRKYEQLGRYSSALDAYRRYLDLKPNAPQRDVLERQKIPNLQAKLRQR